MYNKKSSWRGRRPREVYKGTSRTHDNDDDKVRHKKYEASAIDISTIIFYYPYSPITNLKHARSLSHGRK